MRVKSEEYIVRNSTKYLFALFIVSAILLIPSGIFVGIIGVSIMNDELYPYGMLCLFMSIGCFCVLYFLVFLMMAGQPGVKLLPYRSWLFEPERFLYK